MSPASTAAPAGPILLDSRAIQDLMTRVDAHLPPGRGRLLGFIASGSGEGTTTVAQAYARMAAGQMRRRVLYLDASPDSGSMAGVLQVLADSEAIDPVLSPMDGGGQSGSLYGTAGDASVWELLARADLWRTLRDRYDEVVVDLPSPAKSRLGLAVAPYCDGVAVIVEAEKTRSPVAESLVANLRAVRARVLGAVLNRRRFHLPARVYRML
jgi:Mrp family chromosome partitioning ATPase